MSDDLEKLYSIMSNPDFLSMSGISKEVPIFISTYEPHEEDALRRKVENLASRLRTSGVQLEVIDIFTELLEMIDAEGYLADIITEESDMDRIKLFDLLRNLSDPETRLVPRLMERIGDKENSLTLIIGVGRVFPYLRTHNILECLQPAMMRHPIVMFFPGEYTQGTGIGSQLYLFGSVANPPLYKPFYRAINLEHHRL